MESSNANPFKMVILHLSNPVENNENAASIQANGEESKPTSESVKKVDTEDQGNGHSAGQPLPIKKGGFALTSSTSTNSYAFIQPIQARSESSNKPTNSTIVGGSVSFEKRTLPLTNDKEEESLRKRGHSPTVPAILQTSAAQLKKSFGVGYKKMKKPTSKGWKKVTKQYHKIREHQRRAAHFHAAEERWANRASPHRSGEWNGEHPTWADY